MFKAVIDLKAGDKIRFGEKWRKIARIGKSRAGYVVTVFFSKYEVAVMPANAVREVR